MSMRGIGSAASTDVDALDVAKGMRTCLTVGLALACDAVFENGRAAFARIDELTVSIGLDETIVVLRDSLASVGKLKPHCSCAMDGVDTETLRMMVFQLHMFRMMQHSVVESQE